MNLSRRMLLKFSGSALLSAGFVSTAAAFPTIDVPEPTTGPNIRITNIQPGSRVGVYDSNQKELFNGVVDSGSVVVNTEPYGDHCVRVRSYGYKSFEVHVIPEEVGVDLVINQWGDW